MILNIVEELLNYQSEDSINEKNVEIVNSFLISLNSLDSKIIKILTTDYMLYINKICFNLCQFYDKKNSSGGATHYSKVFLKSIINDTKNEYNISIIFNSIEILCRNSLKQFLFNNDINILTNSINIINKVNSIFNLDIFSNHTINSYLNLMKNRNFDFELKFNIPSPIYIDSNLGFTAMIRKKAAVFNFNLVPNQTSFIQANDSLVIYDKDRYGLYNKSVVSVDGTLDLSGNIQKKDICNYCYLVEESITRINEFIDCFKLINSQYWVQRINRHMLSGFSLGILGPFEILYNIPFSMYTDASLTFTSDLRSVISLDDVNILRDRYENGYKFWEVMLSEAKDYFDIDKYRESIILINTAFENYIETNIRLKLENTIGKNRTDELFDGIINYEQWKFKNKFTLEQFEEFKLCNLIKPEKPTTFKLLGKYKSLCNIDISKTQLDNLIKKIRKNRNDIVHGRSHNFTDSELRHVSKEAIQCFEIFITKL